MEIDLVVTWVDGNDPEWLQQRAKYATEQKHSSEVFFRDWKLLRYWFRGVEQNVSWVRKIHFVTWGHLPPWLNTAHPKLNIVQHEELISLNFRPSFNSNAIILNIHRIKDLAEQFIYINDDMYFIGCVPAEYYFQSILPCDMLLIRPITEIGDMNFGHILWNDISCINRHFDMATCVADHGDKWFSPVYSEKVKARNRSFSQQLRYFPGFDGDHYPNAYLKNTFEKVWEKERYRLNMTCSHRFRHLEDMNEWAMRYWQLAEGNFVPRMPSGCASAKVTDSPETLRDVLLSGENRIVCLNDGTDEVDFESRSTYLQRLFEIILPQMSEFELF